MKEAELQELNAKTIIQGVEDKQITRRLVPEFHDLHAHRKKLDQIFGDHKMNVLFEYHRKKSRKMIEKHEIVKEKPRI